MPWQYILLRSSQNYIATSFRSENVGAVVNVVLHMCRLVLFIRIDKSSETCSRVRPGIRHTFDVNITHFFHERHDYSGE